MNRLVLVTALVVVAAPSVAADVSQDAIDACIDQFRAVGGPVG